MKTHNFYKGLCGLRLWLDKGGCRIYEIEGGGKIGFCKHMDTDAKHTIITLVTDEVDILYNIFTENGVETGGAPKITEKYGIYHFFAKDPDGHIVEIQKFLWDEYYDGKPK